MQTDNFYIFSSFIKRYSLNTIDNNELTNYTYAIKDNDTGVEKSNANGWQSKILQEDNNKAFTVLSNVIDYCCRDYFYSVGVDCEKYLPLVTGIWANINSKYSYNHKHIHTDFCSGVYYVKTDGDEGNIRFCHPSSAKHMAWHGEYFREPFSESNSSEWKFEPKVGDLYVFPSWLEHYVDMNYTEKDRISYSFNTSIKEISYKYT